MGSAKLDVLRKIYCDVQRIQCSSAGHEGLVEDVILLGAPVSGDVKHWKLLTRVVAGKIVNGYAR